MPTSSAALTEPADDAPDAILSGLAWIGLLGILVIGVMMQQLQALLSGMHTDGNPAAAAAAFRHPTTGAAVIHDWFTYAARVNTVLGLPIDGAEVASVTSPRHIVALHAWLDSYFLVPAYMMVLVGLLLLARHRIKWVGNGEWGKAWQDRGRASVQQFVKKPFAPEVLLAIGLVAAILGAVADVLVENPLEVRVMDESARVFAVDPTAGATTLEREIGPLLSQVRVFAIIKMVAIGLAMLCTLLLWIIRSADHRERTSAVWRSVVAVRAQIVVVIVLGFVITRQEAALDAIRGWGPSQTTWTIGLTLLLAYVAWEACRGLINELQRRAQEPAPALRDSVASAAAEAPKPRWALVKLVLSIALFVLGWMIGWQGLSAVAIFVGISALGDFVAPPRTHAPADRGTRAKPPLGQPWDGLALVIAAAVSTTVGLGMIGASFGQLVYQPGVDPDRLLAIAGGGIALATLPAIVALLVGLDRRRTEESWRWMALAIGVGVSATVGLVMLLASVGELLVGFDIDPARLFAIAGVGAALIVAPVVLAFILRVRHRPREQPRPGGRSDAASRHTRSITIPQWANVDRVLARIERRRPRRLKLTIPLVFGFVVAGIVIFAIGLPIWNAITGRAWWELPETAGPIAVLLSFGVVAMLFVSLLSWLAERWRPGRALRVLGARRMPFYALGVVWLLLIPFVDGPGFHDVRLLEPTSPPTVQSVELDETYEEWLRDNVTNTTSDSATRSVSPMLFVASSGGGIRAAYWSALALSCINESEPLTFAATSSSLPPDHSVCASARVIAELRSEAETGMAAGSVETELEAIRDRARARARTIFAMSGISGGSLGVAAYAAHLVEALDDPAQLDDATWLDNRLNDDYLSATMAWALFIELPRAFLRFDPGTDRAEAMEQAWERSWVLPGEPTEDLGLDVGLRELWLEHAGVLPLLLLNSTSVADGCRFNGSVVNAGIERAADRCHSLRPFARLGQDRTEGSQALASTLDLSDFLCSDEDIRLSTVVLMSARFPGISPTGRLEACEADGNGRTVDEPTDSDDPRAVTYLVDGGYLDTSGASALTDVSAALAPSIEDVNEEHPGSCVVPFYVQLDNGHQRVAPPPSDPEPSELRAPLTATNATRGARAASAEAATALEFSRWFSTAGKRLMSGGWPLADRYAWIVPEAHPGVQAPLGWTMSPSAIEDLRSQMRQPLNGLTLQEVRRWLAGGMTCSPVVAGERYRARAFRPEVELGLEDIGGRWIVTDTPQMLSGFTDLDEGMRGSITVIPRIANLSEWMLEACRRIQADPSSGLGSCAGATDEARPSFTLAPLGYLRAFLDVPSGGSIELGTPGVGSAMILATNLGDVTLVAAVSDAAGRPLDARVNGLLAIADAV